MPINCWYIPYRTIQSRDTERPHPASFPTEIAETCIKLHGLNKGRLSIVDPFMGIGNTALACKRLGVSCTGFEIDPGTTQIAFVWSGATSVLGLRICPGVRWPGPRVEGWF